MLLAGLSSLSDDLAGFEPWRLTGPEVTAAVVEVQRARTALDASMSRLAGCADDLGLPREAGSPSVTAWLSKVSGMARGEASKLAAMARVSSEHTEATRAAWAAGTLATDKAKVIMDTIDELPDWVDDEPRADAEKHLIELAGQHCLDDLRRLANRVLEVIDPDGADERLGEKVRADEQRAYAATRFRQNKCGDGTTRGSFRIPEGVGDILAAAIEGIIAPRRTAAAAEGFGLGADDWQKLPRDRKMGHAFAELITHLPTDALPQAGGLAATVAVTIGVDDLRTGNGTATSTSGTTMSATAAQRMACNANLVALYLDGESRVIDHGTTRRLYDRHQRLILAVRDQGCVFPDCDRPPAWCEAHHISFWSQGGPTDLDNAALLCHFHHFLVHEGEWVVVMSADGVPEIIPPKRIDPDQHPRRHVRFLKQQPRAA